MEEARRDRAMGRRLARTTSRAGLSARDVDRIDAAFTMAMQARNDVPLDDHDPQYLHPARVALILLNDALVTDADLLIAAICIDTRTATFDCGAARITAAFGPRAAGLATAVPRPGDRPPDRLLEDLIVCELPVRLVAVAERLDHDRHLHQYPQPEWVPAWRRAVDTYVPVAQRTHPRLAERYAWWAGAFERRFLPRTTGA